MAITDKIDVDFQIIPTLDPRFITIADYSTWGHISGKPTIVEITTPIDKDARVHYFQQGQLNVINSYHLGISCIKECGEVELEDIPDGIYKITIKGSPDSFQHTRSYLRTTLTQLELDKLYINLNLLCDRLDEVVFRKLTDIDLLLKAAEANVRHGNNKKAQFLLFRAQDLIEQTKGCDGCATAEGR